MSLSHTFTIPGAMRGKQRARSTRQGRVYTPAETVNAEAWVKSCAVTTCGVPMFPGAVEVRITIIVAVPASWSKRKRSDALCNLARPIGKPDLDNCAKLILDALNGIMWRDDSQVVRLETSKRYGVEGETVVTVREIHA